MKKIVLAGYSLLEMAVALLLLLYPVLMFTIKGGMNAAFLFLLLISLSMLAIRPETRADWDAGIKAFMLAMIGLPLAIFLSQSYLHHYSGHPYDAASRFLLAVPVFLMLRSLNFNVVSVVQYAFPLAAIVGCLMSRDLGGGRAGIVTMDLIHFGDFELALAMLSIFTLDWSKRDMWLLRLLKIMGFIAGVYASVASGSRGGWIALPLFLVVFWFLWPRKPVYKAVVTMLSVLVFGSIFAYVASQRAHDLSSDMQALEHGNSDTSIGVRLQLFKAASEVFIEHPWFGVGPEGFAKEMEPMYKAGKITAMAADLGRGEVHNELLSKAAALGLFGIAAMLAIYFVPLWLFYDATRSKELKVSRAGLMGLVFVGGFMVFGLTVEILNLTMAAAFYGLTVAVLLAACRNTHRD